MCWYFSLCSFTNCPPLFFRDMLRFLSDEQYDDVILVAEMIPYIEVVVKPRGTFTLLIIFFASIEFTAILMLIYR